MNDVPEYSINKAIETNLISSSIAPPLLLLLAKGCMKLKTVSFFISDDSSECIDKSSSNTGADEGFLFSIQARTHRIELEPFRVC